jgi:hypothetical protein
VQLSSLLSNNILSNMVENAAYQRTLGAGYLAGDGAIAETTFGGSGAFGVGSGVRAFGGGSGVRAFGGGSGAGFVGRRGGDYLEPKSLFIDEKELIYKNIDPIYDSVESHKRASGISWNTKWDSSSSSQ